MNGFECGCKGIRTCKLCEQKRGIGQIIDIEPDVRLYWCDDCGVVRDECMEDKQRDYSGEKEDESMFNGSWCKMPCQPSTHPIVDLFGGIKLSRNFISKEEENEIIELMDKWEWKPSQSGRQKQDFGPKVNFKRKKVKMGGFTGLPSFSKSLVERMNALDAAKNFVPVEQCHLNYTNAMGAAIDPHFDDEWVWGERLVTLNFAGSTVLSFTMDEFDHVEIEAPLPQRSLVVVGGNARFKFKHAIQRCFVPKRRIAATYRELGDEFVGDGALREIGLELVHVASSFSGVPI
eukprot:m.31661 g.31661  ORF g.31661 m.31661 type:complete len:290 (-) comp6322_c0_seq3:159-1028(-)